MAYQAMLNGQAKGETLSTPAGADARGEMVLANPKAQPVTETTSERTVFIALLVLRSIVPRARRVRRRPDEPDLAGIEASRTRAHSKIGRTRST